MQTRTAVDPPRPEESMATAPLAPPARRVSVVIPCLDEAETIAADLFHLALALDPGSAPAS
jgi:hypothetical protein